ncbi:MAG: RNA methyltransferase [Desulfobacterales bacterium CG2_30_60_27]|nr:MAG: RNA methyltransferase [Desulfobacterales bacterium CG2_30_60_27]
MFAYQKNNRYFAQIADGLEELGAAEIEDLGGQEVKTAFRGLHFSAEPAALYRITYGSRLCSRILAPLISFDCHSTKYLYQTAVKLPWHELLGVETTFAVYATVANSTISHSQHAALVVKDALVDALREQTGARPNVNTKNPDLRLALRVEDNHATISFDVAGESLHRRGYRAETVAAPMQETLAAAIIRLADWNGERPLADPMCGSGTLLCEALMHVCRIPAGFLRSRFGFERLPDFDANAWHQVKKEENRHIRELPAGLISGSDISAAAVAAARVNLDLLPSGDRVSLHTRPFSAIETLADCLIVCNPPYGVRLGQEEEAAARIKEFGDFLKQKCTGSSALLYLGQRALIKKVGLKTTWKKPLNNGGLEGVLARYDMY